MPKQTRNTQFVLSFSEIIYTIWKNLVLLWHGVFSPKNVVCFSISLLLLLHILVWLCCLFPYIFFLVISISKYFIGNFFCSYSYCQSRKMLVIIIINIIICIFLDPSTVPNSFLNSRILLLNSFGFSRFTITSPSKIDHFPPLFQCFFRSSTWLP